MARWNRRTYRGVIVGTSLIIIAILISTGVLASVWEVLTAPWIIGFIGAYFIISAFYRSRRNR